MLVYQYSLFPIVLHIGYKICAPFLSPTLSKMIRCGSKLWPLFKTILV